MPRAPFALLLVLLLAGCAAPLDAPAAATPPADAAPLAWRALALGPTPRTEVVVGALGERIYVIGGFPAAPAGLPAPTSAPLTLVEVYDVAADAWARGPDHPLQVHHAAAVTHDGSLYVLGGMVGPTFTVTPLSFRLDEGATAWTPLAPMPGPRGSHAAAAIGDRLYVAGGVDLQGHAAEVYEYDPAADAWRVVGEPIPTPRDHTAGGAVGGLFCVAAGDVGGHAENTDATECFDPASGKWTTHAPVPTLRGSVAAAVWQDKLVVLGGQDADSTYADVEALDLATGTWTTLPPLATPRHGFGAVVVGDALYAAYGGPEPGLSVTSSIERLGPAP